MDDHGPVVRRGPPVWLPCGFVLIVFLAGCASGALWQASKEPSIAYHTPPCEMHDAIADENGEVTR